MDWNKVREKNNQQTVENTDSTFDWGAVRESRNRQEKKPYSVKSVYSNTPQREALIRNIEANTVNSSSKKYESSNRISRYSPRTGEELTAGLYNHILANAAADDRYRQKYARKNYNEIQSILSNLPDGEEKHWLSKYIESAFSDRASAAELLHIQY